MIAAEQKLGRSPHPQPEVVQKRDNYPSSGIVSVVLKRKAVPNKKGPGWSPWSLFKLQTARRRVMSVACRQRRLSQLCLLGIIFVAHLGVAALFAV
jgi:hypothetical protein